MQNSPNGSTLNRSIPALRNTPQELCGPPVVHRPFPNYQYMHDHQDRTTDQLDASTRISLFYKSGQSWANYLTTLPPLFRRHYNAIPPLKHDYPPNPISSHQLTIARPEGYSSPTYILISAGYYLPQTPSNNPQQVTTTENNTLETLNRTNQQPQRSLSTT